MCNSFKWMRRQPAASGAPADVFADWRDGERWLFVSPHDDDAVLGAGLCIQALRQHAEVSVVIVTDGRMGYSDPGERADIVSRRWAESLRAYGVLGLTPARVLRLGFPDGSLNLHSGSRLSNGEPTGLENRLTALLRKLRPTRVATTGPTDWHPDHRATFAGVRMALFHACTNIWREAGEPLATMPVLYSFAVYSAFDSQPDFCIEGPAAAKLAAVREFASQAGIVGRLGQATTTEYLWQIPTAPANPEQYRSLFGT